MRYVSYERDGKPALGIIDPKTQRIIDRSSKGSLLNLIGQGPLVSEHDFSHEEGIPLSQAKLFAPIAYPPKNVLCIGRNYLEHVKEGAAARNSIGDEKPPEIPVFFTKAHTCIIGPEEAITFNPKVSDKIDWEAELAVIIGKTGRDIEEADALDYIFGYTCLNDVTARDLQRSHNQWFKGKSLDTFCPIGPWVVTTDEIGDPQNLKISCRVNGVTKQEANTSDMIFNIRQIISWISKGFTLEPGDIIATGTPSGVGFARTPPEYLKEGDVVEVELEKIGILRNVVKTY